MGGAGTWKHGTTQSTGASSEHLELIEAQTGQSLYSDTVGKMHKAITELRKRIEEQEKSSKAK
jgi:hypothetical protein